MPGGMWSGAARRGSDSDVLVYVLAIGAAFFFGTGSVVQQRAASEAPPQDTLKIQLLWWLAHQRLWLLGVVCSVFGNLLSASALGRGSVALVQPLFTTRLLFALPLAAAWMRHSVPRRDWGGALATALGLAVFVVAGHPHQGHPSNATNLDWIISGVVIVGLASALMLIARRLKPMAEAPVLATGAGLLFALQAALVSTAMHIRAHHGLLAMLGSWEVYAVVFVALYGTLLLQSAFETAPLPASFPALVAMEPIAAIALSVGILGGSIRMVALPLAIEIAGLAVMIWGVYVLASSPIVTGQLDRLERRQEEGLAYRTEVELERDLERLRRDLERFSLHIREPELASKDRAQVDHDLTRIDREIARLCELVEDIERHRRAEMDKLGAMPSDHDRADALAHDRDLDAVQRELNDRADRLQERAERLRERASELEQYADAGASH